MATTKLTAPNGATVSVDSKRLDNLLRYGFTKASEAKAPAKKATSKKATSKKSSTKKS